MTFCTGKGFNFVPLGLESKTGCRSPSVISNKFSTVPTYSSEEIEVYRDKVSFRLLLLSVTDCDIRLLSDFYRTKQKESQKEQKHKYTGIDG